MGERRTVPPPLSGGSSLLVIFAVLCLTVFALLTLSTVRADTRLADTAAEAVADYYEADAAAEELYARLRLREMPAGVVLEDNTYRYACPISETQELQVAVREKDGVWTVLQWQAVSTADWTPDESLAVWDGA